MCARPCPLQVANRKKFGHGPRVPHFSSFVKTLKIANIRVYENEHLMRKQKEAEEKATAEAEAKVQQEEEVNILQPFLQSNGRLETLCHGELRRRGTK